jgi:dienelactone hydrolase
MNKPKIVVNDLTSMIDSPLDIRVTNLAPEQSIILRARRIAEGMKSIHLESFGKFTSNQDGEVILSSQKPLEGSYDEEDKMGLFWSLDVTKVENTRKQRTSNSGQVLSPQKLTLTLEIDETAVDEIEITRNWLSGQYQREPIRENEIVATFFSRKDKKKEPGIIVVGGSEGGLNEYPAALLASHGFSVLDLAYFGIEELPKRLERIPLEYVKKAIDWLKNRSEVDAEWIGIHGTSRGSELALLSASFFSDIKAVVSLNGSAVSLSGIVPWSDNKTLPPAWTFKGEALPFASPSNPVKVALECKEMWEIRQGNPYGKWYEALTADSSIVEAATIPVEKINGPILLISGEEDGANTSFLSRKAVERLNRLNLSDKCKHLNYPGAGHSIGIPYLRANTYNQGNKRDIAYASVDSWKETVEFFSQSASQKNQTNPLFR